MIESGNTEISIVRQCELLGINRSSYYYEPRPVDPLDLELTRKIDEIYTDMPFYGAPKMTRELKRQGYSINHKRIERLMRDMGLQAIFPKKNLSKAHPEHQKYPYLLKGVNINHPNHVWGTDITYIRAVNTWFYLVVILDWYSRYVISWRLSPSLSVDFCSAALEEALKQVIPGYHNSDQGSQFTAEEYINILRAYPEIKISMDGRGRCFDNIFTERLWRTVKYEEVYLRDYTSYDHALDCLDKYFKLYNTRRLHQSLDYQTPQEVYFN